MLCTLSAEPAKKRLQINWVEEPQPFCLLLFYLSLLLKQNEKGAKGILVNVQYGNDDTFSNIRGFHQRGIFSASKKVYSSLDVWALLVNSTFPICLY